MPNLSLLSQEELIRELRAQRSAYGELKKQYTDERSEFQRRTSTDQVLLDVLEGERALVIKLLHTMVPPKIAHDLSNGIVVPPEMHRFCVVFFSDIEGFTSFGDSRSPLEVFDMLDGLFSVMDFCTSAFPALYKVETIGDAYMVVAGILDLSEIDGEVLGEGSQDQQITRCMLEFAILVNQAVQRVDMDEHRKVKIRIGLHHGPVVTGLTGNRTPRFCCFGDTVNTASRMETTGATTKIHISKSFANFIQDAPYAQQYSIVPRESLTPIKGKGLMETFFLEPSPSRDILLQYSEELMHVDSLVSNAAAIRSQRKLALSPSRSVGSMCDSPRTGEVDTAVSAISSNSSVRSKESAGSSTSPQGAYEEPRFAAFNMRTGAPAAILLSQTDYPFLSDEPGALDNRSEYGSRSDGQSLRSASRMSSMSSYSGFTGGKLSSLTHTNYQPSLSQNTESGNNSKSSTDSDEVALLLRRCAALETKYNEAVTAKALADDDRQAALDLMRDNAAKAVQLREKNDKAAKKLKEKHETEAAELVRLVEKEVASLALTDPVAARMLKLQADITAAELRRSYSERAAEIHARNAGKANLLAAKNAAIAAVLAKEQVDAAVSLEIDQSILATDLKMLEDEELAKPPTSSSDEEAKQGDGEAEDQDQAVVVDLLAASVNDVVGNRSRTSSARSIRSNRSNRSSKSSKSSGSGSGSETSALIGSKSAVSQNSGSSSKKSSGEMSGAGSGTGSGTGSGAGSGTGGAGSGTGSGRDRGSGTGSGSGSGSGQASSRSSMSSRRAARLAEISKKFEDSKSNAATTALLVSMAKRQDAADKMREEEEEEEHAMQDEDEDPSPGKTLPPRTASFQASSLAALIDEHQRRKSSSNSSSSSSSIGSGGGSSISSSSTTAAATLDSSGSSAVGLKRRADELRGGINPFTLAEYTDVSFDVMTISFAQPLAITRAILLLIEGICGDMSRLDVPHDVWTRFLWSSGALYHDTYYHNYHHAFCVVQYTAILLRQTGGIDKLTPKELFVALLTAAVHDVDHRGLNNAFHVNSKSQLAQKYSNASVLENHHLDVSFGIMKDSSKNPLARWPQKEQLWFREEITRMVLKTDMSFHNDLTRMLEQRSKQTQPFDLSLEEDRAVYLEAILHAADIANSVRPFAQSEILSMRIAIEFNLQAEKELSMGLPATVPIQPTILEVCKGEQGFLNHVARPYWVAMHGCFPTLEPQLLQLEENARSWQRLADSVAGGPFSSEPIADRLSRLSANEPALPPPHPAST